MQTTKTITVAAAVLLVAAAGCSRAADDPPEATTGSSPSAMPTATAEVEDPVESHDDDHSAHEEDHRRRDLDPWPAEGAGDVLEPVDESWLRAVLTWHTGDQTWAQVSERAAGMLSPDAYVEVLAGAIFDAAIQDVTARHGSARVSDVEDVSDPEAYPVGSGARVLCARVEFEGAGGWSRPALRVVAEIHSAAGQVVAVLIGEGAVTAEVTG